MLKNKAILLGLGLLSAYLLLGYFAAPQLLQPRLEHYVAAQLGRELRFERIQVSPLTWSVQLDAVDLAAGEQGVWPGLAISAASMNLRFSFWRLTPVVAALTLHEPKLAQAESSPQLQRGDRYPFARLWQQLQEGLNTAEGQRSVPVRNWRIEAGQVLLASGDAPDAGEVLLDGIFLQAGPQDQDGLREYSLDFSLPDRVDISAQGLYRSEDLTATGAYQLVSAAAPDESVDELQAAGSFTTAFLPDAIQLDLSDSQVFSTRIDTCVHAGLLCAALLPLDASFDSSLLVASAGIQVLQANARLNAFRLDASLGQGRAHFAEQQDFASARIELGQPPAGSATAESQTVRNFGIQLSAADSAQYQIEGQLDRTSQHVDARIQSSGAQAMFGSLQLRTVSAQQPQVAYPQLELQIENPAASLAQQFMARHLSAVPEFRTLQLQLAASLDELGLQLHGNIALAHTEQDPNAEIDSSTAAIAGPDAALDTEWLLALLRDTDERIAVAIPPLTLASITNVRLDTAIEQQVLAVLTEMAEQPFVGLAKAFDSSVQNLHEIRFAAGSAELDAASTTSLAELADILLQRPGLGVAVAGVYDPVLDKQALQTEQMRTHVALATAADLAFRTGAEPPDFNDAVVHSVIDEFARRRLPADVLQEFTEQFGYADADTGVLPEGDVVAYYSALFDLLVYYAEIPQGALTTLSRYRAQAVTDALEEAGVLRERLQTTAQAGINDAGAGEIPLRLQLKAWFAR